MKKYKEYKNIRKSRNQAHKKSEILKTIKCFRTIENREGEVYILKMGNGKFSVPIKKYL